MSRWKPTIWEWLTAPILVHGKPMLCPPNVLWLITTIASGIIGALVARLIQR